VKKGLRRNVMKKQLNFVFGRPTFAIISLAVLGLSYVHNVKAQTPEASITLPARFSYAAKFVCGFEPPTTATTPPAEPPVKTGNYATVINLHNPWATTVTILKKVAIAAPERFPNTRLIDPTKRFQDTLTSDHGMSIDCTEIVNLLTLNGTAPTTSFIEGWVVIDSFFPTTPTPTAAQLDVIEVTTTSNGPSAAGAPSPVNSHEVTVVPGRSLPAGTWPF
jgi:hypothetical protein